MVCFEESGGIVTGRENKKNQVLKWTGTIIYKCGGQDSNLGTPTGLDPESSDVGMSS